MSEIIGILLWFLVDIAYPHYGHELPKGFINLQLLELHAADWTVSGDLKTPFKEQLFPVNHSSVDWSAAAHRVNHRPSNP